MSSLELPPVQTTGSGDTLADWLRVAVILILSLIIGAIWSLDRRRTNDAAVADFTHDYLRLVMLMTMVSYGLAKVLLQQMPGFNACNLFDTYGESSPMGLAWRFIGFSPAYERFAGLAELLGGMLLLTRRTTTLGGLVIAAVMTNVVMLNFCFDVPVKLYSSHLLVAGIALAWLDLRRLAQVLWNRSTMLPRDLSVKYARSGWRKWLMPALVRITVANQNSWFKMSTEGQTLTLDSVPLQWKLDGELLTVIGTWDDVDVTFRKFDPTSQPILKRGFHWVQEEPFNR